jgi:phosphogluconate dehydratase
VVDERAVVNGIVGLLATGGSTNHTIHLVAVARAAGIAIDWGDFDELSRVVPLVAAIYPNGKADVNRFHAAGGMAFLVRELLAAGLLHEEVVTVAGRGLSAYAREPHLDGGSLAWRDGPAESLDLDVLRPVGAPFQPEGGVRLLDGNLGRAIFKSSAVRPEHRAVTAPAAVFDGQEAMLAAFEAGRLDRDVVVVVRFQGPRANGMPELHKLVPSLAVLQDRGRRVALVTDGRMSGASGKVPAAIHVTPECAAGGALAKVRDGDVIRVDGEARVLEAQVPPDAWARREPARADLSGNAWGVGRELFATARASTTGAEQGAVTWAGPSASGG